MSAGARDLALDVRPLGDGALRLELPSALASGSEPFDPAALARSLSAIDGVLDAVVTERHAAVHFDPARPVEESALAGALAAARRPPAPGALHVVACRYDGADLAALAEWAGLSVDEAIARHAAVEYRVRMVGFLPGFAYLGDVDGRLAVPRLAAPRPRVPAGAVAIAGRRTGVYPFPSPGGWRLVGTALGFTPFSTERGAILRLGDRVRFVPA